MSQRNLDADDRAYVLAVTTKILRSQDLANDATQDALLLAHRHRATFRGTSAHRTWLHRIAVTTALGYLRRQRRSREHLAPDVSWAHDEVDARPSPEHMVVLRELADHVSRLLATVGTLSRRVFLLRAQDSTDQAIAVELGISVANVKIRTFRVRHALRTALAGSIQEALSHA
ncbi:MAG: RNA polymerase sigma factor [Myxococcales bacterium]|nr:RNA polymerase sigma factor [Myxococcales bacterium]